VYTCTCTRTRTCTVQLGRATLFMFIYTHVLYTCTVYRCTRTCTVHVHVRVKDVYHMILPYSTRIINNCTFVDNMICTTYFRTKVLSKVLSYLRKSTIVQICRKYKFVDNITVHALYVYSSVLSKVPYFRKYFRTFVRKYESTFVHYQYVLSYYVYCTRSLATV
jgi:hypothetical protein